MSINAPDRMLSTLDELAGLIARYSKKDGTYQTEFPALSLIRSSEQTSPLYTVYEPSICLVAQGRKLVLLADEAYRYGPGEYFAVSVDLPISGQVIEVSPERPYLAVRLQIDPQQILELMRESRRGAAARAPAERGLYVSSAAGEMLDAFARLLRLLETPEDLPVLAPMAAREILYRALQSAQGAALRQMAPGAGRAASIAEVIRRIRETYTEPLRIGDLAAEAGMSPSSLHRHFRDVTAMSPLQFQKQIRLQEARRMLLSEPVQAAEAAFRVGYESPSQFNREYARLFGLPPIGDVRRLKSLPQGRTAGNA
ncbi:AraC family transcriptional regulator [Saccharibacillus sp. CPCC 101409]|uniref:AraC family transcriptional regulator n=1 Tax=Saccharibacillus sp. CPCC 101409 TaxID=3058041 RepID=UPI0026724B20|nr:AraC family transcriptional regulator [Saccharibacillus sp. CPCC 101409]MDO3410322.1 AraC family transcriptional regulator [Saccharibacillus sp. CPCC 101409]